MKPILLFLLLTILVGCQKKDAAPADLLYRRWQFSQTRQVGETAWSAPYRAYQDDTEYRPDGTLVYRRNGLIVLTPCCSGGRFSRHGVAIDYSDFPPCPLSFCGSVQSNTITMLRDNLLELQHGTTITQYTPVK